MQYVQPIIIEQAEQPRIEGEDRIAGDRTPPALEDPEALDRFTEFHQNYLSIHVQIADAKSGVVIGVSAAVISYLFSQQQFREALGSGSAWKVLVTWGSLGMLMASFAIALAVILPRYVKTRPGLVFFQAVAQYPTMESYLSNLLEHDPGGLAVARAENCYAVSLVCTHKYALLRYAIATSALGMAGACLSVLLLQL